jgi:hypothetical protein
MRMDGVLRLLVGLMAVAGSAAAHDPDFDKVTFGPVGCAPDEPAGDAAPGTTDLVGSASHPAAQVGHDERYLYLRFRVDKRPGGSGGFDEFAWVALLQNPGGNPFQYQYAVALNGAGASPALRAGGGIVADTVELWRNTNAADVDFSLLDRDPSEDRLWSQRYNHATDATPNSGPLARHMEAGDGSAFNGTPDFFIDVAIPVATLVEHGVVTAADELGQLRSFPFASTKPNDYDKDGLDDCASGPCDDDGDCDDGDTCTTDACQSGVCVHQPQSGCLPCTTDGDCDDDDACTTDACAEGFCAFAPIDDCEACTTDGGCDDGDTCTTDACVSGVCAHLPADDCIPCAHDEACDDGEACTTDACSGGFCRFEPIEACEPCTGDGECDDDNACTTDACVEGACRYVAEDPACRPCDDDIDCSDGNGCTSDVCAFGICSNELPDPTCMVCATAEECDDGTVCTDDTCNASGVCEHVARPGCDPCTNDDACEDGNACTSDACDLDTGSCAYTTIPGCVPCEDDAPCADEDECTEDSCFMGACTNVPIPECPTCTPKAEVCGDGQDNDCDELIDCDDENCAASPECTGDDEICGNCEDDDGDGFVDLDDPDCCALSQSVPMRWLRIKTKTVIEKKRMRVKARYLPALPSENFDPTSVDTTFQLSDESGRVFCANLPAEKWRLRDTKRTIYRFKDRRRRVANGLHIGVYREKPKGQVIFRTRGKKIDVAIRDFRGDVRATVRLGDQCSVAAGELREGKDKLVFP